MNNIFEIINTIFVTSSLVAASWIAYKSYKKQRRYNLTDIVVTIIDDEKRMDYYWFVRFRFNNCQKTIEKIKIVVMRPFVIHNHWQTELIKICEQKVNTLELSNIFDEDYVLLCLKIEQKLSDFYRKKVEKNLTLASIIKVDSEFVRLETSSFNYSQLYYA